MRDGGQSWSGCEEGSKESSNSPHANAAPEVKLLLFEWPSPFTLHATSEESRTYSLWQGQSIPYAASVTNGPATAAAATAATADGAVAIAAPAVGAATTRRPTTRRRREAPTAPVGVVPELAVVERCTDGSPAAARAPRTTMARARFLRVKQMSPTSKDASTRICRSEGRIAPGHMMRRGAILSGCYNLISTLPLPPSPHSHYIRCTQLGTRPRADC